jgi:putative methionine-R-sulfoxide reductase with GAF domain
MSDLAAKVRSILGRELTRAEAARQVTDALHAGGFRWVGVYEVTPTEVVNLAWSGPAGPAHPTFPIDQGLTAEAVATGRSVVCNDVAADPRYLTALESTGSEIIVPIVAAGRVAGTLDGPGDHRAAAGTEQQHGHDATVAATKASRTWCSRSVTTSRSVRRRTGGR